MESRYIIILEDGNLWTEQIFYHEDDAYMYLIDTIKPQITNSISILKSIQNGKLKVVKSNLIITEEK